MRLLDYFIVIGEAEDNAGDDDNQQRGGAPSQRHKVLCRYPTEDHENVPFPEHVATFCATDEALDAPPRFFPFVLQAEDGSRLFGSGIDRTFHLVGRGDRRITICLLGQLPFFESQRAILSFIHQQLDGRYDTGVVPGAVAAVGEKHGGHGVVGEKLTIEGVLSYIIHHIPAPERHLRVRVNFPYAERLLLLHDDRMPVLDMPIKVVFDILGIDLVLRLLACVLLEQRILIVSSQLSLVSMACQLALSMNFPLSWPYVFIPLLPHHLVDFMDCPTPYIIGADASVLDLITDRPDLPEFVLFHLDEGRCDAFGRDILPLPRDPERKLRRELLAVLHPALGAYDASLTMFTPPTTFDPNTTTATPALLDATAGGAGGGSRIGADAGTAAGANNHGVAPVDSEQGRSSNNVTERVQRSLAKFVDALICDHDNFIIKLGHGDEARVLLNKFGYLSKRDEGDHPFYDAFVRGQAFQELLDKSVFVDNDPWLRPLPPDSVLTYVAPNLRGGASDSMTWEPPPSATVPDEMSDGEGGAGKAEDDGYQDEHGSEGPVDEDDGARAGQSVGSSVASITTPDDGDVAIEEEDEPTTPAASKGSDEAGQTESLENSNDDEQVERESGDRGREEVAAADVAASTFVVPSLPGSDDQVDSESGRTFVVPLVPPPGSSEIVQHNLSSDAADHSESPAVRDDSLPAPITSKEASPVLPHTPTIRVPTPANEAPFATLPEFRPQYFGATHDLRLPTAPVMPDIEPTAAETEQKKMRNHLRRDSLYALPFRPERPADRARPRTPASLGAAPALSSKLHSPPAKTTEVRNLEQQMRQMIVSLFEGRGTLPTKFQIGEATVSCVSATARRILSRTMASIHSAEGGKQLDMPTYKVAAELINGCLTHASEAVDFRFFYQIKLFSRTFYTMDKGAIRYLSAAVAEQHDLVWRNLRFWEFTFWKSLRLRRVVDDSSLETLDGLADVSTNRVPPMTSVMNSRTMQNLLAIVQHKKRAVSQLRSQGASHAAEHRRYIRGLVLEVLCSTINDMHTFGCSRFTTSALLASISAQFPIGEEGLTFLRHLIDRSSGEPGSGASPAPPRPARRRGTISRPVSINSLAILQSLDTAATQQQIQALRKHLTEVGTITPRGEAALVDVESQKGAGKGTGDTTTADQLQGATMAGAGKANDEAAESPQISPRSRPSSTAELFPPTTRPHPVDVFGHMVGQFDTWTPEQRSRATIFQQEPQALVYPSRDAYQDSQTNALEPMSVASETAKPRMQGGGVGTSGSMKAENPSAVPSDSRGLHDLSFKLRRIVTGTAGVSTLSVDTSVMACGALDGTVAIYRLNDVDSVLRVDGKSSHKGRVTCSNLEWARLTTGGEDGTVRLWDVAAARPMSVMRPPDVANKSTVVTLQSIGELSTVSGHQDGSMYLWDCRAPTAAMTIVSRSIHGSGVLCSDVGVNHTLLTGHGDKVLRYWDLRALSSQPVWGLLGHRGAITHCKLYMHEFHVPTACSGDCKGMLRVWDVDGQTSTFKMETFAESPITSMEIVRAEWIEHDGASGSLSGKASSPRLSFAPHLLMSGDALGAVRCHSLDGNGGRLMSVLRHHDHPVTSCETLPASPWTDPLSWTAGRGTVSSQGRKFYRLGNMLSATADTSGVVRLWSVSADGATPLGVLSGHRDPISALHVVDGLVIAGAGQNIYMWHAE